MARRTGSADLPLHGGRVPPWLGQRMATLGAIVCRHVKASKPLSKSIPIRLITITHRHPNCTAGHCFDPLLKHRPIIHRQERFADVDPEVGINPYQVCIERSVMKFG